MKVPWIPRPLIPQAVEQYGVVTSASQLQLARETAALANRTCASRWCKTFADPESAPVAELVNHTTEAQFIVGNVYGSATQKANFGLPWLHQAGQYGIIVDVTLVADFELVLAFRFSGDDWLTVGSVTKTYSAYVTGKPWEPLQHELWVRKAWKYGNAQAVTLTAQLDAPDVPNATTDRSILLEFYCKAQTYIGAGPLDYSGDHLIYISDIRVYDTLNLRSYP